MSKVMSKVMKTYRWKGKIVSESTYRKRVAQQKCGQIMLQIDNTNKMRLYDMTFSLSRIEFKDYVNLTHSADCDVAALSQSNNLLITKIVKFHG